MRRGRGRGEGGGNGRFSTTRPRSSGNNSPGSDPNLLFSLAIMLGHGTACTQLGRTAGRASSKDSRNSEKHDAASDVLTPGRPCFLRCSLVWCCLQYANLARRHPVQKAEKSDGGDAPNQDKDSPEPGDASCVAASDAVERATRIFERAVTAVPFCLEIWKAYVAHMLQGSGDIGMVGVDDTRR